MLNTTDTSLSSSIIVRQTTEEDLSDILRINRLAFGSDTEPDLVRKLLVDETAIPQLSLIALLGDKAVGHVLFTRVLVDEFPETKAMILAPVAVTPGDQKKGIGSQLIQTGLTILRNSDVALVFVLGHPDYYPRCGFVPAGKFGFSAPYPIPKIYANAWMVHELISGALVQNQGRVLCAATLNHPEYWCD